MTNDPTVTIDPDAYVDSDNLVLTTVDNPYNPKDDYYNWKRFDSERGYYTEEYIARLIVMDEDFNADDDFMTSILTDKAIQEILANDDNDLYRLV